MDGVLVRETRLCACRRSSSERGTCNAAGCIPSFPCTCNVHVLFRHYRHRGKISVPAVPRRRRRGCCKVPYRHSFLHVKLLSAAKYRQPLSSPQKSHRVPSYHSLSITSVLSSTPSTPSSLPTHSVGSTKARPSFPPPSAYIGHRRERSKEVLQHLSVLAPAKEAYV